MARSGSGRGGGRTGGRGGGRGNGRPCDNWKMVRTVGSASIVDDDQFRQKAYDGAARKYGLAVTSHVSTQLVAKSFPRNKVGLVRLFMQEMLERVVEWSNELIRLNNSQIPDAQANRRVAEISILDMWEAVAMLLASHSTNLSLEAIASNLQEMNRQATDVASAR